MADLLSALEPELAALRASDDQRVRDAAQFITTLFSAIDTDHHGRGLHDFKGEFLTWIGLKALRVADKLERQDDAAYSARRMAANGLKRLALSALGPMADNALSAPVLPA